jgi:hypoxanthine phosphoribosyltransferase
MLPATLLSHNWKLPVKAFNLSLRDNSKFEPDKADWIVQAVESGQRILVVDDINDSGATVNWIRSDWQSRLNHVSLKNHVRFAVLLHKQSSQADVDYFSREITTDHSHVWWVFPWENLE